MNPHQPTARRSSAALRHGLLVLAGIAASATSLAQALNDVPMAVKNNVAPNFMFMIDSSGSMSNIVPSAPYSASATYTGSCPSATAGSNNIVVPAAGSTVDLNIAGGVPYAVVAGVERRHTSVTNSGNRVCFVNSALYPASLLHPTANYLPSEYTGHYLNWYFGNFGGEITGWTSRKLVTSGVVETRLEVARASATSVINTLPISSPATVRVGLSSFNTVDSGNGGSLLVGLADLTSPHRTSVLNGISALAGFGSTPLAETLADIGRYLATGYSGNITAGTVSGVSIDSFLRQDGRNSCLRGADCLSGATDAVPATPGTGTPSRPVQYWCQRSYAFLMTDGRPQGDQAFTNNAHLRDYDRDCTGANASACAGGFDRKTAREYESAGSDYLDDVAKALFDVDLRPNLPAPTGRTKLNNLLTYTIGFADTQVIDDPLLMSTATQGGGRFLYAQDGTALTNAFNEAVTDAFAKDAAAAAVAVIDTQLTVNNVGYRSSYNSGSWYGDLVAMTLSTTTGEQTGADLWSLREKLRDQTPASRKIATFNGSAGVRFASGLSYTGKPAALTDAIVEYVRGNRAGEGTTYRRRQDVLGDIVNAEPVVMSYGNVPIIFQGANDGMLHVVDGRTDTGTATRGQELWAYVPRLVHDNLHQLASTSYSHRYFVDGTPAVAQLSGQSFSRLLVGGLGKGGRGYYALNISSYTAATEADAAAKALWEFSPTGMGFSFGKPLIINTAAGWRVVVASGYGATVSGRIWVLNPATGAVVSTIDTGVASSGLAHLARLANVMPDAPVRYVWGGDLLGNVWRFDLDSGTVRRLATVTDSGGVTAQPITSAPEVGLVKGSSTTFVINVGSGRYLADEDVPGAGANTWATQRQSVYGLFDDTTVTLPATILISNLRGSNGSSCPSGGGNGSLVCQSLTHVSSTNSYRATTHAVDPATRRGWYIDLPLDANLTHGRVIGQPSLSTGGTLALTVNVPTNTRCDPGGSSWYLAINSATGGAVQRNVGGTEFFDAGEFLGFALASRAVVVTGTQEKRALIRMSDQSINRPPLREPVLVTTPWRRIYWRSVN